MNNSYTHSYKCPFYLILNKVYILLTFCELMHFALTFVFVYSITYIFCSYLPSFAVICSYFYCIKTSLTMIIKRLPVHHRFSYDQYCQVSRVLRVRRYVPWNHCIGRQMFRLSDCRTSFKFRTYHTNIISSLS